MYCHKNENKLTVIIWLLIIVLFNKYFLDLWLEWIKDEKKIATSDEEKKHVIMLCEKGVKDYLSKYITFIFCNLFLLL